MLQPVFTRRFAKSMERCKRRNYDMELFKEVAKLLIEETPLPEKNRDHKLSGLLSNHRECHIKPDWLLIYRYNEEDSQVIFEDTGTHADLFEHPKRN